MQKNKNKLPKCHLNDARADDKQVFSFHPKNETMKVYISGPMTGLEDLNFPAFYAAEERLLSEGFKVLNPAREDDKTKHLGITDDWVREDYLRRDLILMLNNCDAIYLLKGWEDSWGANLELHNAEQLQFDIMYE